MKRMPQEIEVWYVLPAIRRELARSLINDYGLSQKKAANRLGITEAAISQYVKAKRGSSISFGRGVIDEIRKSAGRIVNNQSVVKEVQRIAGLVKVKEVICSIHKEEDDVPMDCRICFARKKKGE